MQLLVEPPFTVDEFYRGARQALALPENAVTPRTKPRASGLCRDPREIAYMMAGFEHTDELSGDSFLTGEQGRWVENMTTAVLNHMEYYVADRQVVLPADYCVSGHADGQLIVPESPLVWGFEHKHFGRWGYEDILKQGLAEASPDIIAQVALYGDALGWDRCLVVVTSQDASSIRSDMTKNKNAKNPYARWADEPGLDPKVQLFAVDIAACRHALLPALKHRAQWFTDWYAADGDPRNVAWSIDPNMTSAEVKKAYGSKAWQYWDYSNYKTLAIKHGQGLLTAPPLPWEVK